MTLHFKKNQWIVAGIGLMALIVGSVVVLLGQGHTRPRQAELVARFNEGRESFEKLRSMFVEDDLETIGEGGAKFARKPFVWTSFFEANVPESRARIYTKLMAETKVQRMDRGKDGSVKISLSGWGMANRGWRISLVWRLAAPNPQLASIDEFKKSKRDWEEAYSHVADNWYLYIIW